MKITDRRAWETDIRKAREAGESAAVGMAIAAANAIEAGFGFPSRAVEIVAQRALIDPWERG